MDIRVLFVIGGGLLFLAVFMSGYALLVTRPNIQERVRGGEAPAKSRFEWVRYLKDTEKVL